MVGSTMLYPADVRGWIGREVVGVARVFYSFEGEVEPGDGPLEITFAGGSALLFDSDAGGERLRVTPQPWVDPFEGPQTAENLAYLETHGCWRRVDVSADPLYAWLCEEGLQAVDVLDNPFGVLAGIRLTGRSAGFCFFVSGDECHVSRECPAEFGRHGEQ